MSKISGIINGDTGVSLALILALIGLVGSFIWTSAKQCAAMDSLLTIEKADARYVQKEYYADRHNELRNDISDLQRISYQNALLLAKIAERQGIDPPKIDPPAMRPMIPQK